MAYTNIDDPSAYFQAALYTGNGNATNAITNDGNSDLQPDFVWVKRREGASDHVLQDSSRGFSATTKLASSSNQHENDTNSGGSFGITDPQWGYVSSASSDGFNANVGTGTGDQVNKTSSTYVAWQWKANGGTTASNTDGSKTATVQANQDAGFSIVTYAGSGSASTVGHGLADTPDVIIFKNRSAANVWATYHQGLGNNLKLELNSTNAQDSDGSFMNGTLPTSSVFTVGASVNTNGSGSNYVAYCFAEKQGYSKFGSYVGNANTNGTFVYLGFKPAFIIFKNTQQITNWAMYDVKRDSFNVATNELQPNTTAAANDDIPYSQIDILSNGIKMRNDNGLHTNAFNGQKFIYMAFAENPFVTSTGVPTTAR